MQFHSNIFTEKPCFLIKTARVSLLFRMFHCAGYLQPCSGRIPDSILFFLLQTVRQRNIYHFVLVLQFQPYIRIPLSAFPHGASKLNCFSCKRFQPRRQIFQHRHKQYKPRDKHNRQPQHSVGTIIISIRNHYFSPALQNTPEALY